MRLALVATIVSALLVLAAPAFAGKSVTVDMTAHLTSDYHFDVDFTDTSDFECTQYYRGKSTVFTDMTTAQTARFKVTKVGKKGYYFQKQNLTHQQDTRGIDLKLKMTRATQGAVTSCKDTLPFPADGCGARSWTLRAVPGLAKVSIRQPNGSRLVQNRLYFKVEETVESLQKTLADDEWARKGCGIDTTNADSYITQTSDGPRYQDTYFAVLSPKKLFSIKGKLTVKGSSSFKVGSPGTSQFGAWTDTRSATVTIRKR